MSEPVPEANPAAVFGGCGCMVLFFFMFFACYTGPSSHSPRPVIQTVQPTPEYGHPELRDPHVDSEGVRKVEDSNVNSDGVRNNSTRPVGGDPSLQNEGDVKVVGQHMDANGNLIIEVDTVQRQ